MSATQSPPPPTLTASTQVLTVVQQKATKALCRQSFEYFCSWLKIKGEQGGSGMVPFELYDYQRTTAHQWQGLFSAPVLSGEVRLKARQLGYSWLAAALKLWVAMYHANSDVGYWSKGESEVVIQFRRIQTLYNTLPAFLQEPMDWKQREIVFEGASAIYGFPSTKDAGIGYTFRLAVQDEAAAHEYGEENYGNYQPALMDNGAIIIFSSASPDLGPNGFFWEMHRAAERHKIEFLISRFEPWWVRPPRHHLTEPVKLPPNHHHEFSLDPNAETPSVDHLPIEHCACGATRTPNMEWYNRRKSSYIGRPEAFSAHYPFSPSEAFVGKQGLVFPDGPNIQITSTPWENWRWRIAGIDFGGGDPTAIVPIGISQDQHFHQPGEYYRRTPVGIQEIYAYLARLHEVAPFSFVACDPSGSNRVLIETLEGMGLPAIAAQNRRQGLDIVRMLFEEGRMTIDPSCSASIEEFAGYRWSQKRDPHSKNTYNTTTPVDNHGDSHDARRYALVTAWTMLPQRSDISPDPVPRREYSGHGLVLA